MAHDRSRTPPHILNLAPGSSRLPSLLFNVAEITPATLAAANGDVPGLIDFLPMNPANRTVSNPPVQITSSSSSVAKTNNSSVITTASATRALAVEYKSLQEEPVEGFCVKLVNGNNLFEWEVAIFGPPDTLYMGGYFKARMKFPNDYPYSPPSIRFLTKVWHPNVYENGDLCISILHPPVDDLYSGELPCERWNPTQSVRTILLSVISLLNEPNTSSPANVDASVMYRRWRDTKGRDKEYENIIRKQVQAARLEAERDGIKVPLTLEDYCIKTANNQSNTSSSNAIEMCDFYDDDYDLDDYDDDDDDEDAEEAMHDGEDSGNEET